jgi:hypothetical protein
MLHRLLKDRTVADVRHKAQLQLPCGFVGQGILELALVFTRKLASYHVAGEARASFELAIATVEVEALTFTQFPSLRVTAEGQQA